jgi:hypothetical protein
MRSQVVKTKFFDLLDDENFRLTPKQVSKAEKLGQKWIRRNQ